MKKLLVFILLATVIGCSEKPVLKSPDSKLVVEFNINENGEPFYEVSKEGEAIISKSKLGFILKDSIRLVDNFKITSLKFDNENYSYTLPWGEVKKVNNNNNEMTVSLESTFNNKVYKIDLIYKVFNDGIGFRYSFPKQENLDSVIIIDEKSEFNFTEDAKAWWIEADFDSYEKLYNTTKLSECKWANTPVTIQFENGRCVSIHEAALTNYSGMTLKQINSLSFESELVPYADSITKVKIRTPFKTPWRVILITEKPEELITSNLILNLNEPSKVDDTSWIKPMKYIGIWWGMHLGLNTWNEGPRHGANTKDALRYIDFAAKHNIKGVLYEGWNTGWENWGKEEAFDFVTPYKDFDIKRITDYAEEKGIEIIGHHETGGDYITYERYIDKAFEFYSKLGINSVKTGYAGPIPNGEHHHGQIMVNHYRKVLETALKYKIMIDAHEPIKATGIRRTYPNMMSREGARGMEWNAWSEGNPPEHACILPFTRMIGGPLDYTPGIFDVLYEKYSGQRKKWNNQHVGSTRVHTTVAKQLALMVVLYSPVQMAADLIENYEGKPEFKFIEDLNVDYDTTVVLNAKIGDYLTVARKAGDEWFLGSITDENKREFEISLDFLDSNTAYLADIYADGLNSNYKSNPYPVKIEKKDVTSNNMLKLKLAPGGGQAIRFYKK